MNKGKAYNLDILISIFYRFTVVPSLELFIGDG